VGIVVLKSVHSVGSIWTDRKGESSHDRPQCVGLSVSRLTRRVGDGGQRKYRVPGWGVEVNE